MQANIKNLSLEELQELLSRENISAYHAKQIFRWVYQKNIKDFNLMSDLNKPTRQLLAEKLSCQGLEIVKILESRDKTKKFVFKLSDANIIESALIPADKRSTVCLSSQVGCKFSCAFCLSAVAGFIRNLEVFEIINQFTSIQESILERITHIVFMGIGEPLDNYENVMKAIRIFNSKQGLNIAARRITISTAGVIPGIERLEKEKLQFELSVSLHSAVSSIRDQLMPINKKYPLEKLVTALKKYYQNTKRQITFEYVLLKGINCDEKNAQALVKLSHGFDCKFNLIAYNASAKSQFAAPDEDQIKNFESILRESGLNVTLRKSRGQDINAACGQLRANFLTNA